MSSSVFGREEKKMVRTKQEGSNKILWTVAEDKILIDHVKSHGKGRCTSISKRTGPPPHPFWIAQESQFPDLFLFMIVYFLSAEEVWKEL